MSSLRFNEIDNHRQSLPIWPSREQIESMIRDNKCVVIVGEPGSGKTTQIPQFLHENGSFSDGLIGCTQPRRVAATTVARRVAKEQGCRVGKTVGYSVRFDDCTSKWTRVKYLTDGMLLQEALVDPLLSKYKVVIVDEAHERSLQSDIILGILKRLLTMRQDSFRVVIMSATLDSEEFVHFFPAAKTFYVEGRQHPVNIYYLSSPEESYLDGVLHTTLQVHLDEGLGDILVFLTGEEEIEAMVELIKRSFNKLEVSPKPPLLVLSIYAAMSPQKQMKVFESAPAGTRKVILSTNISETSITIPGIGFVIDSGVVKQRSYSPKTGIDSLQVVAVSKAQAKQRSGRAGRQGPGKAFRLFTEDTYETLKEFTKPEILRTNLSEVVLKLKAMGIDDLLGFDFISPPPQAALLRSLQLLYSLGALDDNGKITSLLGNCMSRLPIDPTYSKMLITAFKTGCGEEMLSIVSMLSITNLFYENRNSDDDNILPRKLFMHISGDHLTLLNVFNRFTETEIKERKSWCSKHCLNHRALVKALEIRKQLKEQSKRLGIEESSSLKEDPTSWICKALVSGLFFHAARRQENGKYKMLSTGQKFQIHPSSASDKGGSSVVDRNCTKQFSAKDGKMKILELYRRANLVQRVLLLLTRASSSAVDESVSTTSLSTSEGLLGFHKNQIPSPVAQLHRQHQVLFRSTCWEDVKDALSECSPSPASLVLAWNILKQLPEPLLAPRWFLDELAVQTKQIVDQVSERQYASVWHGMGRLNYINEELLTLLMNRGMEGTRFLRYFSPRHLSNVVYSVAKLKNLAKNQNQMVVEGRSEQESLFVDFLIKESFRKLNEMNEQDVANLSLALGLLGYKEHPEIYKALLEEVEKGIHLERFSEQDLGNVCYGLVAGGQIDLYKNCQMLVKEVLEPERIQRYHVRQLTLLIRCLTASPSHYRNVNKVLPLFRRVLEMEKLDSLCSTEFRSLLIGLGMSQIEDSRLWNRLADFFSKEENLKRLTWFDLTVLLYSMALVGYKNFKVQQQVCHFLLKDAAVEKLTPLAVSNCFYAVANLRHRNQEFVEALCNRVCQKEISDALLPTQLSNIVFNLGQIGYRPMKALFVLVQRAVPMLTSFSNYSLVYFIGGLTRKVYSNPRHLKMIFQEALKSNRLGQYTNSELSMLTYDLQILKPQVGNSLIELIAEIQRTERQEKFSVHDRVRILQTLITLRHPLPQSLKQDWILNKGFNKALPSGVLLEWIQCLYHVDPTPAKVYEQIRAAIITDKLPLLTDSDLSELLRGLCLLCSKFSETQMYQFTEEVLEIIVVHGSLRRISNEALYSVCSFLRYSQSNNDPLIKSLALEATKAFRLQRYSEQSLTGVFYDLSSLKACTQITFKKFVEEMELLKRRTRYQENHVIKILKGMTLGRYRDTYFVNSLLNVFLFQDHQLTPTGIPVILFSLSQLCCWKKPYLDILVGQMEREKDFRHYSLWDVGTILSTFGRMSHYDQKIVPLLVTQLTKERLKEASSSEIGNLVFGLSQLKIQNSETVFPLLSEALKESRCQSYKDEELIRLINSLSGWEAVDPSLLTGFIKQLTTDRIKQMDTSKIIKVLKSLSKAKLVDSELISELLETLIDQEKLKCTKLNHLYDLEDLASVVNSTEALERIKKCLEEYKDLNLNDLKTDFNLA